MDIGDDTLQAFLDGDLSLDDIVVEGSKVNPYSQDAGKWENGDEEKVPSSRVKHFRRKRPIPFRYHYPYNSPVLKKYSFDPNNEDTLPKGTVVVSSLKTYRRKIKNEQ